MTKRMRLGMQCVLLMGACTSAFGYSNPIEGSTTETVTNLWNVPLPWLIVGGNSDSNSLVITDGGQVNNAIGYIGNAVTSTHNGALITGDGSAWNNSMELSVGYLGASNSLTVADGGTVTTPNAYIGNNSDGNAVVVTGSNSLLDAANLNVGYQGSSNSLLITEGGTAESEAGTIGSWIGSDHNVATVQSNGTWNSSTELNIGEYGAGNQLIVGGDGYVESPVANVGFDALSSNNTVTVTGGSAWLDAPELYIGGSADGAGGTGNLVEVENGGTVATESLNIYSNNAFDLNDGGRLFVNTNFNASTTGFNFNAGGTLEVGGELTGMSAAIEDQRSLVLNGPAARWEILSSFIGGGLAGSSALVVTNGGYVSSPLRFEVVGSSVVVSGLGSTLYQPNFTSGADAIFGPSLKIKNGGMLLVEDGGLVSTRELAVGWSGPGGYSSSNRVLVSGSDSVLEVRGGPPDGPDGGAGSIVIYEDDNELRLEDGGQLLLNGDCLVYGDNNALMVTGAGSVWSNSGALVFGDATYDIPRYDPGGNTLTVSDGGEVMSQNGYIGYSTGADSNTVLVTGSGSVWTNSGDLMVGGAGSYNTLDVTAGGAVYSDNAYIGYDEMASGNSAMVSGNWSTWANDGELHVGYNGSDNSLRVGDKGHVYAWDGMTIGHGASATSNQVTVSGNSSFLNVGAPLMVARWLPLTNYPPIPVGEGNGLTTTDGGLVMVLLNFGGTNLPVFGEGGSLRVENNFLINANGLPPLFTDSGNNLTINNGFVAATPADFSSDSGIMLDTESALESSTGLTAGDGAVLEVSTNLIVGSGLSSNTLVIVPDTFPTIFPLLSVDDLYGQLVAGHGGSYNSLDIEAGGWAASGTGIIGATSNAWFNSISVSGDNSRWMLFGNLYIGGRLESGTWNDGGLGNALYVADGGLVDIAFDLHNRNYSIVNMDPGGLVSIGGDYYQDDTALLRFGVETNAAGAPVNALMTVGGTAEFEEGAQIEYASNVGELLFDRFYTNKLIEADALVVAGITNANSLDLERLDASGSLVDVIFWEHEQDIYALAGRKYLTESAGFDPDSMMGRLAKEIDDMSLLGRSGAMGLIELLNTMTGSEQYAALIQEYAYSAPSYLHAQGMTEGLGELSKHTSRYQAAAPQGANGPHRADQGLRGWIRPYGTWSERSAQDGFSGYDHNVYGTIVGMDWIQSGVLLGVAGGYARSDVEQDDGDASEAETGYGVFYASVGTKDWFGDINIAVGRSDIDDQSGTELRSGADYEASNFALYLGGGKELRSSTGMFSFTPKASLLLSDYYQKAYTEEIEPGVVREVASYEHSSILSSLGAAVAMQKEYDRTILRPEARLRWLHEFNTDAEQVDFVFSEGLGGEYYSLMPAPEEDVLEAGAGLTCTMNARLSLVLDVDWRFGEDYDAYAVSGRATVEF